MSKPESFRTGYITVSQPRVWQDHAVMTSVSMQLGKINSFEEKVDLNAIQGKRARRYYQVLGLKGAVDLQFPVVAVPSPTTPATPATEGSKKTGEGTQVLPKPAPQEYITAKVAPDEKQGASLEIKEFPADIKEDPFDGLQRVDDFYQTLSGVRLTHLRDTASMQKGWSVYLLGFDISLVPGSKTSKDHSAYIELEITGKKTDDVVNNEKIRVYGVWPQRYAERFNETLSLREDLSLALKAAAQAQKWSAEMAQDLAQRHEDDSALIQRYPLISGFVRGGRNFGWEFNPRLRIVTKKRFILPGHPKPVYWMEPGMRHCYVLVAVNDGRIEADKSLLMMDKENLRKIAFGGKARLTDLPGLKKMYEDVLKQVSESPLNPQPQGGEAQNIQYMGLQPGKEKGKLEKAFKRLFSKVLNEKDKEKFSEWEAFHSCVLGLCGHQGKDGINKLELKVSKCCWFNLHNGKKVEVGSDEILGTSNPMIIELPDKLDRTLENIWPVRPNWGLTDQETTVTIKGENFSTDAMVFVGGIKVEPKKVSVVGKDFIVATFPSIPEELLEGADKKAFAVKVITGGDSLNAEDAFTYIKSKVKKSP